MGVEPTLLLLPKQAAYHQALTLSQVGVTGIAPAALCSQNTRSPPELYPVKVETTGYAPVTFWMPSRRSPK